MRFTPSANAGANVGLVNNHSQRLDREPAPNEQGADVFKVAGNGLESLSPWSDFGLVLCTDNKVRRIPIKSVLFGVADGVSEGVDGGGDSGAQGFPLSEKIEGHKMLIEGYGNAIVPQLGAEFIRAFMENEKKERS